MMHDIHFSIAEALSIVGLFQCVYILVYMGFRPGRFRYALVPMGYFLVLGAAFFMDAGKRNLENIWEYYSLIGLMLWFLSLHLGVLLILQLASGTFRNYRLSIAILVLPVLATLSAGVLAIAVEGCTTLSPKTCAGFRSWLILANLIAAGLGMLALWLKKDMLKGILALKYGRERYWLVLTLVINNICFLLLMLALFDNRIAQNDVRLVQTVLGLAFVYLVTTSIFRVFPRTIWQTGESGQGAVVLTAQELEVVERIKSLLRLEKVYQEAGFGRADLARELGVPETQVSHLVNIGFGKSLPQLLNEYRIDEAKQLLRDTNESISVIAVETGFQSIATFNRVFKETEGCAPTHFRKETVHES